MDCSHIDTTGQLAFPFLKKVEVVLLPSIPAALDVSLESMPETLRRYTLAGRRAMNQEGINFTTYTMMAAIISSGGSVAITKLSEMLCYSYHAILRVAARTPWFIRVQKRSIEIALSGRGAEKAVSVKTSISRNWQEV